MTEDNVLVNAVSSDGKTVFKTNDPQPIKKYQSSNMQSTKQSTKPSYYTKTQSYSSNNNNPNKIKSNKNQMIDDYDLINSFYQPVSQTTSSYALPSMNDQWDFFQNFNKYVTRYWFKINPVSNISRNRIGISTAIIILVHNFILTVFNVEQCLNIMVYLCGIQIGNQRNSAFRSFVSNK